MKKLLFLPLLALIAACGPPKLPLYEEIKPDETAYVIPLEGDTANQGKFASEEMLEKMKVASKRIYLDQIKVSEGRGPGNYKWVPSSKVIRVSRNPVSREWTGDNDTGTDTKDQRIRVESLDSVGFSVGAVTEARIEEENTTRFLYRFHGKSLTEVIDVNIRNYYAQILSREFGSLALDSKEGERSCKSEKSAIAKIVYDEASKHFLEDGITITFFGLVEGLEFEDKEIQKSITRQVEAKQDLITATAERAAQAERNLKDQEMADRDAYVKKTLAKGEGDAKIEEAKGKAAAANELLTNKEALEFEILIYERRALADATVEAAKNLPKNILPEGSPLLLGLDTKD